jgi:hypothetical protein
MRPWRVPTGSVAWVLALAGGFLVGLEVDAILANLLGPLRR